MSKTWYSKHQLLNSKTWKNCEFRESEMIESYGMTLDQAYRCNNNDYHKAQILCSRHPGGTKGKGLGDTWCTSKGQRFGERDLKSDRLKGWRKIKNKKRRQLRKRFTINEIIDSTGSSGSI